MHQGQISNLPLQNNIIHTESFKKTKLLPISNSNIIPDYFVDKLF